MVEQQVGGAVPVAHSRRRHPGAAGPGARSSLTERMPQLSAPYCHVGVHDSSPGRDSHAAIVVVRQARGHGSAAAHLKKVTVKTFLDIEIDGKPSGSCACGFV